jgi:hypothetical protein
MPSGLQNIFFSPRQVEHLTFNKSVDCVRQNVIRYGCGRMKLQIRRENVKEIVCR